MLVRCTFKRECNVSNGGALSFVSKKRLAGLSSRFYSSFLIREQMGLFLFAFFLHFDLCHSRLSPIAWSFKVYDWRVIELLNSFRLGNNKRCY